MALSRALTEAAQSRLNVISGAREDLNGQVHRRHASYEEMRKMLHTWSASRSELDLGELPHSTTGRMEGDLRPVLDGLGTAGLDLVFATELAPPDLPFSRSLHLDRSRKACTPSLSRPSNPGLPSPVSTPPPQYPSPTPQAWYSCQSNPQGHGAFSNCSLRRGEGRPRPSRCR
ncbi:YcaO-like family protein [Streptomyces halstedii]|uniref:YcaO-like family protein n=1 Tax=Streptomyces halstedii TaxID=1944 RepID=UPI0036B34DC1